MVVRCFVSVLVSQSSWCGVEWADCFAWFVCLVSHGGYVALPGGVMGLSAVCDCGMS